MLLSKVPYNPPRWAHDILKPPSERVVLTHASLASPTPIMPLRSLPDLPPGFELYVKRDDYTSAEVSGNNVRKLEFLMADALEEGADCIVTIGGVQSNHCVATSVASRLLGLEPYLILCIEDDQIEGLEADHFVSEPRLVGNSLINRFVGSHLRFVTKSEVAKVGSAALITSLCDELRTQGRKPYGIPLGGSSGLGAWGYVEALREMQHQTEYYPELRGITDVAFACGSGGMAAGLALANNLGGWDARLHAYAVCDDPEAFYTHINDTLWPQMGYNRWLKRQDGAAFTPLNARTLLEISDVKNLGYGVASDEEMRFYAMVAQRTGLILDHCYTGKAFYGMYRQILREPNRFKGRKVLFIHTGGLLSTFATPQNGEQSQTAPALLPGLSRRMTVSKL